MYGKYSVIWGYKPYFVPMVCTGYHKNFITINKMSSKRIYGIDFGKGLAIAGMLLAHTFEGGVCNWENDIELKYVNMIPSVITIIGAPIMLICLMGLFFTYLTSMTCTMSMLRIEKKGEKYVMSYLIYRLAFAFVLKGVELVMFTWWSQYGVFDKMEISWPVAAVDKEGGTLDSVGVCGFLVPLLVHLVRKMPYIKETVFRQVGFLTTLASILLFFYESIANFALAASGWCFKYDFNFLGMLFSKIATGPFMLAQCVPFGIIGGALSLLMVHYKDWKYLWRYAVIIISEAFILTIVFFLTNAHPFEAILSERKPYFVRFLELCFETFVCVLVSYFTDNENRPLVQRYHLNKNLTFFRKLSVVSLSAFIFELWVSKQVRKVFNIFVGPSYDATTREVYWNLWTGVIFMIVNYALDLWIIMLWEKINFNFSCEHLIANILSYIFGKKEEVNWKESNDKVIYGPNKELEAEILLNSKVSDKLKGKDGSDSSAPVESHSQTTSEIEMTSSFIEVQVDLDKQ